MCQRLLHHVTYEKGFSARLCSPRPLPSACYNWLNICTPSTFSSKTCLRDKANITRSQSPKQRSSRSLTSSSSGNSSLNSPNTHQSGTKPAQHSSRANNRKKKSRSKFKLNINMAKVCLVVIDGWGISEETVGNAIVNAKTPVMSKFSAVDGKYLTLDASGEAVGLPAGLMGNSEVGHLNIGAGRVMYQDILRINKDCRSGNIANNPYFVEACQRAIKNGGRLHLLGLVSDGGVHGHIEHLLALLAGAKKLQVPKVFIHFFADGRDTPPKSGLGYMKDLVSKLKEMNYGSIVSVTGRYYAMDRDKRWERIKVAYDGLVEGQGEFVPVSGFDYSKLYEKVEERYNSDQTDEFLAPIITNKEGLIKDGDTLMFFNFRSDRMRQITETFGININFETSTRLKDLELYTMNQYKKEFPFKMLYPPIKPVNVLAEAIGKAKVNQFHCAETEKYAHVTFFFNGGQEAEFEGEVRKMVPSPKVATYDLDPEMSASKVADEMCKAMEERKYQFVMCNFAPPDMVGHTGKYEPTRIAVEATDKAIGRLGESCEKNGYILLVTSDHGNAERMIDEKGGPVTSHTTNRVPFVMHNSDKNFGKVDHNAALCDVAPTVLKLMNIAKPAEMDGQPLL